MIDNATPSDNHLSVVSQYSSRQTGIRSFTDGLAIVVLCILSACIYGIVHDQITARVCIEYFTIGHPQILKVPTESPTLLGFVWGIVATWWVGLGLGIPLAIAACFGARPKKSIRSLLLQLGMILTVTGTLAAIASVIGYVAASKSLVWLCEPFTSRVPPAKHPTFVAALFAHNTSYTAGSIAGLWLIIRTWRSR
ncbi:MAG: hypothetical protein IT425_07865 [Pirellulales bacterium]|nr:hypothetical protein [Pirellulales bacterium]